MPVHLLNSLVQVSIILNNFMCRFAQILAVGKKDDSEFLDHNFEYWLSYLTLVEATLESTPQLVVQLYLAITDTPTDTISTRKNFWSFF